MISTEECGPLLLFVRLRLKFLCKDDRDIFKRRHSAMKGGINGLTQDAHPKGFMRCGFCSLRSKLLSASEQKQNIIKILHPTGQKVETDNGF